MRFALLVGCLSSCACAAVVTMRLRSSLSRKLAGFPPIHGNTTRLDPRIHSATDDEPGRHARRDCDCSILAVHS